LYSGDEINPWYRKEDTHGANVWKTNDFQVIAEEVWDLTGRREYKTKTELKENLSETTRLVKAYKSEDRMLVFGEDTVDFTNVD
jgi:hypothetical protein